MVYFTLTSLKKVRVGRQPSRYALPSQTLSSRSFLGQSHFPLGIFSFLMGALIIFTLSIRDNKAVQHLNALLLDVTTPLVDTVTQPFTALACWSETLRTHHTLRTEVGSLREENKYLLSQVQLLRQQAFDNDQLRHLVRAIPDPEIEHVSARVIGRVSDGANALLTIRATESVVKDQAVITADGIVGRINKVGVVSSQTAQVMPITDQASRIPVEIESTQEHGIIAGQNTHELRLIHLEKRVKVNVKVGDRLITSGYGGIFPRGYPVAIVTHVTSDVITARPFVTQTPPFVTVLLNR